MAITREKAFQWAAAGLAVIAVLIGIYAGMLYGKVDELESALARAMQENQNTTASAKKVGDEARAAAAKSADAEKKLSALEGAAALLGKAEPRVSAALEAAAAAKGVKPDAKAELVAGVGLIGLVTGGAKNEAALNALGRALQADSGNCLAIVALTRTGKTVDVPEACKALMPAAAAAPAPAAPKAGEPAKAPGAPKS